MRLLQRKPKTTIPKNHTMRGGDVPACPMPAKDRKGRPALETGSVLEESKTQKEEKGGRKGVIKAVMRSGVLLTSTIFKILIVTATLAMFGKAINANGMWLSYTLGVAGIIYVVEPWLLEMLRWEE